MVNVTSGDVAQHLRDRLEVGLQAQCRLSNGAPPLLPGSETCQAHQCYSKTVGQPQGLLQTWCRSA